MQQPTLPLVKIVIMGSGGVGKTALTLVFMYEEFNEDYEPTKADSYTKKIVVDDENITLDILDTAGQEDHACVIESYFKGCHGALFVFDATMPDSVIHLSRLWDSISRAKSTDHPLVVVVANKMDLIDQIDQNSLNAGRKFAKEHNLQFIETSAKTGLNVGLAFTAIAREIRQQDHMAAQASKPTRKKPTRKRCVIL